VLGFYAHFDLCGGVHKKVYRRLMKLCGFFPPTLEGFMWTLVGFAEFLVVYGGFFSGFCIVFGVLVSFRCGFWWLLVFFVCLFF